MMIRPIFVAALSILAVAAGAQPPPAPAEAPAPAPAEAPAPSALEDQVLAEINKARTNPAAYASTLREYRSYFDGNIVTLPDRDVGLRTREGVAAVDEAIAFLAKQPPVLPLRHAPELALAAKDLTAAQLLAGGTSHAGTDGSDAKVRIKKHKGSGFMAEAMAYGAADAAAVVRQLIVDDGFPTRPNRKILFEKRYFRAGVSCGSHPVARSVCVIDLASFVGLAPDQKQAPNPPVQIDIR